MNADFLVSFPGMGIHDLPVSRVAFSVFGFSVYWYGLLIALSILICLALASKQASRCQLKSDDILDTFILIIPMMIVFARAYYVIFEWSYYSNDWRRIIDINHGGLAFYGGVIGGALAILIITRIKKIPFSRLIDFLAVYVPLGQAIGRWGNFFNQEAFGTNTSLPWGMYSNQTAAYLRSLGAGYDPSSPVHPTFMYEFLGNMLIFAILLLLRRKNKTPFRLTFYYLLLYGLLRFFVERIRTDPLYIPGSDLRISVVVSALMVIGSGIALILLSRRQQRIELAAALAGEQDAADGGQNDSDGKLSADLTGQAADTAATEKPDFIPLDEIDDLDENKKKTGPHN